MDGSSPKPSVPYYVALTDDALVAEAAAGADAFRPEVWEDLQRELRRRGLKRHARRMMRRAAVRREVRARQLSMSLGFSIAAPIALVAGACMLPYVTTHLMGRGNILALPLLAAVFVLFGVGIPIDLLHDKIKRNREAGRRSSPDAP